MNGLGSLQPVSYTLVSLVFSLIFQSFSPGHEAAHSLRSVLHYIIKFRTLAADSGWNNSALVDAFLCELSAKVRDQLFSLDMPEELDNMIALANKTDHRLQDSETHHNPEPSSSDLSFQRDIPQPL